MTDTAPAPTSTTSVAPRAPRRVRRGLGIVAMTVAALGLAFGLSIDADAATTEGPATIGREAYFTNPLTQATPPLIRAGFPPSTVCLVAGLVGFSQLCGTEVQSIAALLGLTDGLPILTTPDGDIAQPVVLPGTTPIGMLAGQQRYVSLVQPVLPVIPDGERLTSYELVFKQAGLNFALESPAFRGIVLSIISQLGEQDPDLVIAALQQAISGEVPLITQSVTGIEACPITDSWNAGPAQGAGLDGTRVPRADCILGTTGVYDPAAQTWTFDITFAAQAWIDGRPGSDEPLANEGILLRPLGAPNLAYGDPDLSTNWLVSLANSSAPADQQPVARYSTAPIAASSTPAPTTTPTTRSAAAPAPTVGRPAPSTGSVATTTPSVSGPAESAGPLKARFVEGDRSGTGSTPAWVWLALPLGLLGALLFAQSLGATPATTRRRPGALARLVAANEHAAAASASATAAGSAAPPSSPPPRS